MKYIKSTFAPKDSIGFGFTNEPFPKLIWTVKDNYVAKEGEEFYETSN